MFADMTVYNKRGEAIVYDENYQEILKICKNNKVEILKSNIICSDWNGRCFKVDSKWNLLMNVFDKNIKIYKNFGEEKKERELIIKDIQGQYIKDHKPLTKNRVILLTDDGVLSIYSYRFKKNKIAEDEKKKISDLEEEENEDKVRLESVQKIELMEDEITTSLAVSPLSKYVIVSSRAVSGFYQRSLYVFKIQVVDDDDDDCLQTEIGIQNKSKGKFVVSKLVFATKLDFSLRLGFGNFLAISLPFYVDDQPVFFGLQQYGEGSLCSYILKDGKLIEFFKPVEKFSIFENSRLEVKGNCVYNMNKRGQLQVITWNKIG